MKLYGVESKFRHRSDNGAYRSFVYLASDEDDAIRQFNLDPNHRVYQDVLRVYQITYEKSYIKKQRIPDYFLSCVVFL